MEIRTSCSSNCTCCVKLSDLKKGEVFRERSPSTCKSVWMVTDNRSTHPDRRSRVRTVSLKIGSVSYKNGDYLVTRVKGFFDVTDWGCT